MLLTAIALATSPTPTGVTDEPFNLVVSVRDEEWRDTITTFSRPVFAERVHRTDLRCDLKRTFCERSMDAYVSGSELVRRVHINVREWDGEVWRIIATPVVTLPKGESEARIEVEGMSMFVRLSDRALEPQTI
ncbi:hypothetical protein [Sphingomicrobium aestuariivivum]|uniref:hypothetical protein n=1 Tax=Sphingomicrobium aestuariivivum TaxID=1582356 RepID=UPI001FD6C133|nr:hypothetical protein [Sphingomicrobium aestuariivivum]MCJ8191793.1 hypothetical protein [Sphingomicrobium aestuariivivum]